MAYNPRPEDTFEISTIEMERIRIHIQEVIGPGNATIDSLLDEISMGRITFDHILGRHLVDFTTSAYGEKKDRSETVTVKFEVPDGWWNTFKEEKFPAWLKKRFPIKFKTLSESKTIHYATYSIWPEAKPPRRGVNHYRFNIPPEIY